MSNTLLMGIETLGILVGLILRHYPGRGISPTRRMASDFLVELGSCLLVLSILIEFLPLET